MPIVDLKLVPGYLPAHGTTREALLTRGPMKAKGAAEVYLGNYIHEYSYRFF